MSVDNASFRRRVVASIALILAATVATPVVAADDRPDCTGELEQIPRDGSTIEISNPWLSYSGHLAYSALGDVTEADVSIEKNGDAVDAFDVETLEADSQFGVQLEGLEEGAYLWRVGDGGESRFLVGGDARFDETPPTLLEGDVKADVNLKAFEEFPVVFRQWELSFPAGDDDHTAGHDMRYLVEFVPEGDDEPSDAIVVTPPLAQSDREEVTAELGGRPDGCRHVEPGVALTEEATIRVRAIDLAGNLSDEAATGRFEGIPAEELAAAHEEMSRIADRIEDHRTRDDDESESTEEVARQLEEQEDATEDADGEGCSAATGGVVPVGVIFVLGLVMAARRKVVAAVRC